MSRRTPALLALALLAGAGNGNALRALQSTTSHHDSVAHSSPALLPPDHWSRYALRRLASIGLLEPAEAWTTWPAHHHHVLHLLNTAVQRSMPDSPSRTLARALETRLSNEFNVLHRSSIPAAATAGLTAGGRQDELIAGNTVPSQTGYDYTGPRPRRDAGWIGALVQGWLAAGWLSGGGGLEIRDDPADAQVDFAYLAVNTGRLDVWAGRRNLAFQAGSTGAVVLSGSTPLDGIGFDTPNGFRLPSFLRAIGTIRVTQILARMVRSGPVDHPLFLAQRLSVAPADRLVIGVNRAAIFGGEGNLAVTPWRVLWLLLGQTDVPGKDSDFENQVVSLDMVVRPFDARNLVLHLEWGFDDAGAAFLHVPGIVAGITYAGFDAVPWAQAGLEVVRFAGKCCGYPEWYWHGALPDGWTDRGVPIGHPLGGHGTEVALLMDAYGDSRRAPVIRSRIHVRDRGRQNLFAPEWAGRSAGVVLDASIGLHPGARLDARADLEAGSGWSRAAARVAWIWTF